MGWGRWKGRGLGCGSLEVRGWEYHGGLLGLDLLFWVFICPDWGSFELVNMLFHSAGTSSSFPLALWLLLLGHVAPPPLSHQTQVQGPLSVSFRGVGRAGVPIGWPSSQLIAVSGCVMPSRR